jgi:hypothetical protein
MPAVAPVTRAVDIDPPSQAGAGASTYLPIVDGVTRGPIDEDDLDARVFTDDEVDFVATAQWFEDLAGDPHPDDAASTAMLLVVAGDHLAMAGQHEAALERYQRAVADGGECTPDARCSLLAGLFEVGRGAEASALAAEIRAARLPDPWVYHHVGETYETRGDVAAATTWFTAGLLRFLHDDDVDDLAVESLAGARSRVRGAQGFPMDEYDELAEEMLEVRLDDLDDDLD